ncbi:hypothetical protein QE328_gp011 [Pseudomonas phage vB_PaM_EPA1]|uniref:Uncharacterized protein n=2 Tax=Pakpunavirus TaxID=1921407 RepID=A0A410T7Z3_9CAUD|nr:hypothetical protein QE327_gp061 [Pseudomonas phage Henu5]YP_010763000.1 hypothetical protein QE328_gp011 [Pseudomonas phage vB_PaM_EPA1]QAU05094.1 hypothetical protein Henu5_gp64 [Pseudomonas phage Henu5]QDF15486.1 hypothetical protein EPA1_10 [Pseudomonas phage vB_PaM_EPA1]
MNSIAALIKEGMRIFFLNQPEPYMCYILEELAMDTSSNVTVEDVQYFKGWLDKNFGIGPLNSVMSNLDERHDPDLVAIFANNPPDQILTDYRNVASQVFADLVSTGDEVDTSANSALGRLWCNFYVWAYFDLIRKGGE